MDSLKVANLLRNLSELCLRSLAYFGLCCMGVYSQGEQFFNFSQREAQFLSTLDETNPACRLWLENAIASVRAGNWR